MATAANGKALLLDYRPSGAYSKLRALGFRLIVQRNGQGKFYAWCEKLPKSGRRG